MLPYKIPIKGMIYYKYYIIFQNQLHYFSINSTDAKGKMPRWSSFVPEDFMNNMLCQFFSICFFLYFPYHEIKYFIFLR